MAGSLRPDLIIRQIFRASTATVPTANNPAVLIGINRQVVYKATAGSFQTNALYSGYEFPGLVEGALVEAVSAGGTLSPQVFLSTPYGVAEVTDDATFDLGATPPTFELSPTTTAVFDTVSGDSGNYSSASGQFTDPTADFVADQVAAGDIISVGGREAFTVTSLVDDTTLGVSRIDRGPMDSKVKVSAATGLYRTITYQGDPGTVYDGFVSEGVRVGDVITLQGWDDRQTVGDTVSFTAEDANGERVLTFSSNVTVTPGDLLYLVDDATGSLYPAMMITLAEVAGTASAAVTISPKLAASAVAGSAGVSAKNYELYTDGILALRNTVVAATVLGDLGSRTITGTFSSAGVGDVVVCADKIVRLASATTVDTAKTVTGVSGSFDEFEEGDAIFLFSGAAFADNRLFTTITTISGDGSVITLADTPADSNGTLTVVLSAKLNAAFGVDSATNSVLTVSDVVDNGVPEFLPAAGLPTKILVLDGVVSEGVLSQTTFDLTGQTWVMTLPSPAGTAPIVGDLVFSQTGLLLFVITVVNASNDEYEVEPDSKAGITFSSSFTLPVVFASPTEAELIVTKVASETSLVAKDTAGVMTAGTFVGMRTTVVVADALEDVSYTTKKTVSSFTADVLVSYTARRTDHLGELVEVDSSTVTAMLGQAVPDNPLGLAAAAALQNSSVPIYCVQVAADTLNGWTAAVEVIKTRQVYVIAPLTQNETFLALFRNNVATDSEPEGKRERKMFQSHRQETSVTRYTWEPATGDTAVFVCETTGSVPTITWDSDKGLPALGVIAGDMVSFEYFGNVAGLGFVSGTVSDMRVVSVGDLGDSSLTLLRRSSDPLTLADGVSITSITITSRTLTPAQVRDAVAAYPGTIASRRISNIYPDRCLITFSDETNGTDTSEGLYGGGEVTGYEIGGWYLAAIYAVSRASIPVAATLTKRPLAGVQRLVQGGGSADTDLDRILDGGNMVIVQPSGENTAIEAIRAVTTDVSQLSYLDEGVTMQVDNFVRIQRSQVTPLLGLPLNKSLLDLFSVYSGAGIRGVIDRKELKEAVLLSVQEDAVRADTLKASFRVAAFYGLGRIEIDIFI